jgi:hypothetical protein
MVSQTFKSVEYELPDVSTSQGGSSESSSVLLSSSSSSLASSLSSVKPSKKVTESRTPQPAADPVITDTVAATTVNTAADPVATSTVTATTINTTARMLREEYQESFEEAPLWAAIVTYMGYLILNIFGFLRDFFRYLGLETKKGAKDPNPLDFVPLFSEYECFYTRNLYTRIRDCFNRPICSVPGANITLVERLSDDYNWTFKRTGKTIEVLNMGSYNYLGFAENSGKCAQDSVEIVRQYGVASCVPRQELGEKN